MERSGLREYLVRGLIGGLCGWAALPLIGYIAGSLSLFGGRPGFRGFMFVDGAMEQLLGSEGLAVAAQFALFFAFGALIGIATVPFADSGRTLLFRSALHFLLMEGLLALAVWLNFGGHESPLPWMAICALVYAFIWGARWLFWWFELGAIREKLGLTRRKKGAEK